jgi:hypothetical protein
MIRQTICPPQYDVGHRPRDRGRIEVCYRS